jgi:hypothetical protein
MLQGKIKWLIVLVSFKAFIETYKLKINIHVQICEAYRKLSTLTQTIYNNTNLYNGLVKQITVLTNSIGHFNDIYKYTTVLTQDISNTKILYDKYQQRKSTAKYHNDIVVQTNTDINNFNTQIDQLTKQHEQIIIENNICPCCGQKITTQEHVQHISNFMKGR